MSRRERKEPFLTNDWVSKDQRQVTAHGVNSPDRPASGVPYVLEQRIPAHRHIAVLVALVLSSLVLPFWHPLLATPPLLALLLLLATGTFYRRRKGRMKAIRRGERWLFVFLSIGGVIFALVKYGVSAPLPIATYEPLSCEHPAVVESVVDLSREMLDFRWGKISEANPHELSGIAHLGPDGNWTVCRGSLTFYQENPWQSIVLSTGWTEITFDYQFVPTNDGGFQVEAENISLAAGRTVPPPSGATNTDSAPAELLRFFRGLQRRLENQTN